MAQKTINNTPFLFGIPKRKIYVSGFGSTTILKDYFIQSLTNSFDGVVTSKILIKSRTIDTVPKEMSFSEILAKDVETEDMLKAMYKQIKVK